MKKNIIIKILSVLVIVFVLISSHFYKETKRMKVDVGYEYVQLISDSRYTVENMAATNLRDALQTEHGLALIETFKDQAFNKEMQFRDPFSKIGDMFYEAYRILDKALERGEVSDKDLEIYKDRLNKLSYIMMDLDHYSGSMRDLFDSFNGKVDPEITEKIKQRIEADY